jgi:transcriptional regulator with XRE-family HTH domain
MAATGVDDGNISKYETGVVTLELPTLERLLDGYGATLRDLADELDRVQGVAPGNGREVQVPAKSEPADHVGNDELWNMTSGLRDTVHLLNDEVLALRERVDALEGRTEEGRGNGAG